MPALPWQSVRPADPDREYLVLLTHLPLRAFWMIPRFLAYAQQIQRQLKSSRGLIGYSLLARPLQKKFWTLSAWEDEGALMGFVQHPPHVQTMSALAPQMGRPRFDRWHAKGGDIPPTWPDALQRFDPG